MPILTNVRRERFCQGIAEGLTATQAYRQAGYSGSGHVAEAAASRLLIFVEVSSRIAELQQKAVQRHEITVDSLTRDLFRLRDRADQLEQTSAAVAALALVAKIHGFDRTQLDVTLQHKPAPLPTKQIELSEEEWRRQFDPQYQGQ